jgi:hypothetical protein
LLAAVSARLRTAGTPGGIQSDAAGPGFGAASLFNPGGTVNDRLKPLMKELSEAINESLSESEQIAEVISKIKAGGYDVFLVLEATIGFNRIEDEEPARPTVSVGKREPEFKVNAQDLKFLKSLRISVQE